MALIGTISRALLYRATAYYVGGTPITVLTAQGNVVIGAAPPAAPTITGAIADRVYEVGSGPYTINLNEKFAGAGTYIVSPSNPNLSLSGATLTITPTATMPQTTISVVGRNGGGDSPALTFTLTVNAVAPTVTTPLPDQNIAFGAANVTVALDNHFTGVASYSVSPAGNGATISGRSLVLSAAQTRSLDITVTGTNSTGQSVSYTFLFVVAQTTQAPAVTSAPTISGGTTVGSLLTRTAGTATGIPTPMRATVWLRNSTIIAGQTGNTLDTTDFEADDQITTRDDWTNTQGSASGTSAAWVLTAEQTLTASVVPNPIVMNEPFTVDFNAIPDSVSSSVTLTGTGSTRTGTGPATSPVSLGGTKVDWAPYSATITVDTAVITPNAAITPAQLYAGQTVADIPNFASINSTSYFTRTGRTIASVQAKKGQMVSPGPDEPPVLSSLVNVTGATAVAENDKIVIDVTDSGGTVRRFELADVQYALKVETVQGRYKFKINDLVPPNTTIPFTDGGVTTQISRAMMADGEHPHIAPVLSGTAEVGATLTWTEDVWFIAGTTPDGPHEYLVKAGATTVATVASGATRQYVVQVGDAGKTITVEAHLGGSVATSNAISIPAAGPVVDTFTAPDETTLAAYVGESGLGWNVRANAGLANGFAIIRGGLLRPANANTFELTARLDPSMADQFAEADVLFTTATDRGNTMTNVAVRISTVAVTGYGIVYLSSGYHDVSRWVNGTRTTLASNFIPSGERPAGGSTAKLRLEAQGSVLRVYLNGVLKWTYTDSSPIATGRPGIITNGPLAADPLPHVITNFTGGAL